MIPLLIITTAIQNIISIFECYDSLFVINIIDRNHLWEITHNFIMKCLIYFVKFDFEVGLTFFNLDSDTHHCSMLFSINIYWKQLSTIIISPYIVFWKMVIFHSFFGCKWDKSNLLKLLNLHNPLPSYSEIQKTLKDLGLKQVNISI